MNVDHDLVLDAGTGSWQLAGGTILGGTVATADGTALVLSTSGTLDSVILNTGVRIAGTATLNLTGAWSNRGTLTLSSGTLNLGGVFTPDALGDFQRRGGTVNLTGTLNNVGRVLVLNATTGPWRLDGGTINGGSVLLNDGTTLTASSASGNSLNGVTVDGDIELSGAGQLTVTNGLTLNGTLALGNSSSPGTISFNGSQTFTGAAVVRLGNVFPNSFGSGNGTVTLGPNVVVQGGVGRLNNVINQGLIDLSQPSADVYLQGSNWRNTGTIRLSRGTINLDGMFTPAALGTWQRSGGTVNVTGTLNNAGQTLDLDAETGSWQLVGGQINGGIITTSGGAELIPGYQATLNGVTLETDVTVGPFGLLSLNGSWVNRGTLRVMGGVVDLGGTFTLAALGNFRRSGGTVNLTGTLDNTGTDLLLDDATGNWYLGGTIHGGTVITSGSASFLGYFSSGHLDGVVFNGQLQTTGGTVTVTNGLTLNGTLDIGAPFYGGNLIFQGTQTVSGTGTVVFSDAGNSVTATDGTVTFGPQVTLRGGTAFISGFINQGTFDLSAIGGHFTLAGTGWRNDGVMILGQSTLDLGGTFTREALGDFRRSGGTVNLTGTLDNTGGTLNLNDATGSWRLAGGTILGGTVTTTGVNQLLVTEQGGTLDGVNLETTLTINPGQHLGLAGTWQNRGRLLLHGGQLDLGGAFTPAALGHFRWTTGTLNLTGTLDNTGTTLDMDHATGSFDLNGGTILGGTVNVRGAAHLVPGSGTNQLIGVTVNGSIDIGAGTLTVTDGLVVNGTVTLGIGAGGSHLTFAGSQTFAGVATVLFEGSGYASLEATNGTVTLAPSVTVLGQAAQAAHLVNVASQGTIVLADPKANLFLEGNSWRNEGRIDLTAGTLNLGGTFSVVGLGDVRRLGGTVNLTGVLDNTGQTLTLDAGTGSWQLVGGTIRRGTVIAHDGAALIPTSSMGTLDGVTLEADVTVASNARLSLAGNWSNQGILTMDYGLLNLGGTFTLAALGTLRRQGGTVSLTGTLENSGTTVTLTDATGGWVLDGGTIDGGTVDLQGSAGLTVLGGLNRVNAVTINGNLNLVSAALTVTNGLTLNGTLTLGAGFNAGALLFRGTQTLDGNATIMFQGGSGANALVVTTDGDTLTLGPNVNVHGSTGSLGESPYWTSGINVGLVIEGTISAEVMNQTITLTAATIDNQGLLRATNGGILSLERHESAGTGISNSGMVFIDAGSNLMADGVYVQTDGATYLNGGTLAAPLVDLQGGLLGGAGVIVGHVRNAALITVGFDGVPGSLAIQGDYTQTADGTLAMEIGGTDPGTGYDYLSVSGTATLDGTLEVSVLDGFFAQPGDTFTLVNFGQLQGEFATVDGLHPHRQEVYFDPVYDDTGFTLVAMARRHGGRQQD